MLSSWTGIYPLASSSRLKACLVGYPLWVNPEYLECFISLQGSPKSAGESVYDFKIHYKLVKKKNKTQQKTKQEKRNLRNLYSRTCCHFYIFPKSSYSFCFTVSLIVYNLTKSQKKIVRTFLFMSVYCPSWTSKYEHEHAQLSLAIDPILPVT